MTLSKMDTDTKLMTSMMTFSMTAILAVMLAQYIQQIVTPVTEAAVEPYGMFWFGPQGYIMNVEYGPDEEPSYMGEAVPGTPESYPGWRIYRYEYVVDPATGDYLHGTLRYANGSTAFDKIWDNREDYDRLRMNKSSFGSGGRILGKSWPGPWLPGALPVPCGAATVIGPLCTPCGGKYPAPEWNRRWV